MDDEVESLQAQLYCSNYRADYWEEQVRRAEDKGQRFALTQDGQLYRLEVP
ncbi:MAG: hypothetical protein WDM77_08790 [Steroidobacteraceae bacterium]